MAQLPNVEAATIPRNKLENYLLDLGHPIGGGKAKFFLHFGFRRENWQTLADAVRLHARQNPAAKSMTDADGIVYLVEGPLETPSGRRPRVRAVWLMETGELAPRFISAYPLSDDR
jgi:hypothetical protein